MKIRFSSINIYLSLLLIAWCAGCQTTDPKKKAEEDKKKGKEASTLRLHLETNADGSERNSQVPIFRERPVLVNVERMPFITEGDVDSAAVVEADGGFAIKVNLNKHGSLVLDMVTGANRGRRIAIQTQYTESRWLGAPVIKHRISNGVLVFTPDANREEADRIVRGLNNLVKKLKKKESF